MPKSEVLFDYGRKQHVHMKSGSLVEMSEEQNYLFDLGRWKQTLQNLYNGPQSIVVPDRMRSQIFSDIQSLPEVPRPRDVVDAVRLPSR